MNGKQRLEAVLAADVASTALGIEVRSHGDGRAAATMTVRPHMTDGYDIARPEVRTRFGRVGIYDVEVSKEDGTVIAEFRGHSHELGSSRP